MSESAWAEKLAAAEARIRGLEERAGKAEAFVRGVLDDWRESDYQFDGESMDGWAKSCGYMVEVPPGSHSGPEWDCDACEGGTFSCWELRLPEAPPPEAEKRGEG